jgi:hypothetical protein
MSVVPTNPLRPGAPLPDEVDHIVPPHPGDMSAELIRAQVELMYAIARHRKAWAAARALAIELDKKAIWKDSDGTYIKALGDVRWWREEMSAQATTVSALQTTLQAVSAARETLEGYAETTSFGEQAKGQRTFLRRDGRTAAPIVPKGDRTVREVVDTWAGNNAMPTKGQYRAARIWMREMVARQLKVRPEDQARCDRIIELYESKHGRPE